MTFGVTFGVTSRCLTKQHCYAILLYMARPLRIQYPDAVYHVTCRGNEKQNIYRDDTDRNRFLLLLNQSMNIYTVKLHSYVLMTNHFHLLVETPLGNLSEFMRHFNIAYIGYFNRRHKRVGHLYQGRYKAILVDKDAYLSVLSRYIHLNPVKIKAMEKVEPKEKYKHLKSYLWSSLPGYLMKRKKQLFVRYDLVLADYGGDTDKARRAYRKALVEEMIQGKGISDEIIGQSVIGGEDFISWVKAKYMMEEKDGEAPAYRVIKRHGTKEEIIQSIIRQTGKRLDQIKREKGLLRRITMDLLYRHGDMTNPEIGQVFGVDYSSVSQERRRLRMLTEQDRRVKSRLRDIEMNLSSIEK
jgi:putative transposase